MLVPVSLCFVLEKTNAAAEETNICKAVAIIVTKNELKIYLERGILRFESKFGSDK